MLYILPPTTTVHAASTRSFFHIINLQSECRIIFIVHRRTIDFAVSTCLKFEKIKHMYAIYVIYPMLGIVASGIT